MLEQLKKKFIENKSFEFEQEENEFISVNVNNRSAKAKIYLHGAHITEFKPHGQEPILWLTEKLILKDDFPIRGGIPICWPWFAAHPADESKPFHGFVRKMKWDLLNINSDDKDTTIVELGLKENNATIELFPYKFEIIMRFTIAKSLKFELLINNKDTKPFITGGAFHTYFNIGNIDDISIEGLDKTKYIDSIDKRKIKEQKGDIKVNCEVDRIYFNTESNYIIKDAKFARNIFVNKKGSSSTVVWNPWIDKAKDIKDFADNEYKDMVCIEIANAEEDVYELAPNETHILGGEIGILD